MKRIVIDARILRTTTGRYIERLMHYLQEIDKENEYLILLKPEDMEGWEPTNPNFKKVSCPIKEFTFKEQVELLRQISELKAGLVHFPMVQQPVFYPKKTVTTMQDLTTVRFRNPSKNWLVFTLKQWVYVWVNKRVAHKTNAIITPSEFVKDDVARFTHTNSRKITVTYEGSDKITEEALSLAGLQGTNFIMYVGRPSPHKNLERLIEAYAILKNKNPDLKLVLVGKKDVLFKRLESSVQEKELKDVLFTGFVSEGQLRWLYENCRAYIFPSLSEGFGLPGLEAMVHGAPVVSSNATCLPEIYGEAAEYFDPLDIDAMAAAIGKVINSNSLREKLIEAGSKQAKKYSWKTMAEQTLAVYKQVLG